MGITLHDYWRSSASYRVRIALGLKGLGWTSAPVDLRTRENRAPAHLKRNPQGLVPVLDIDGHRLTQSLAIIEYLDETRPAPPLLPADPTERARLRAVAHAVAMEIAPVNNLSVVAHVEDLTGSAQARPDWMRHFMLPGLHAVEALLDHPATGPFCHGAAPGLADICVVPQVYNAERWQIPLDRMPRIRAVAAACAAVPAFVAAHPDRARPAV
ncbi:maleylacetoacetate isomerase [Rhodobacteraceae bacterium 2CG4]|uniref:Maleylacetoacetate isomerase n=1 Tax=Halovulum marinum TaxID=2662447 RepID=A0A6L5Z408_9RHOB|nr:maleylacetoacetate isomerase [Halovulum marinum]MSU91293.1 maleylacetoacetate isomerase [Halovulum marinum]